MSRGKARKKTFTDDEYTRILSMFVDKLGSVFDTWPTVKDEIAGNIKQLREVIIEHENTNRKNLYKPVKLWLNRSLTEEPNYIQINVLADQITFDYTVAKTGEKDMTQLLKNIRDAFPNTEFENLNEQDVKRYFIMTPSSSDLEYVEYIFMDMATNNETISKFISKSELDKTDKKWYTIGYHKGGKDTVKPDLSFTVKPVNDEFGSHKVSIYDYQTKDSIQEFMIKFLEIMKTYETVFVSIDNDYKEYGITMDEDDDEEDEEEDDEGEAWRGGSSKCPKARSPPGFRTKSMATSKWKSAVPSNLDVTFEQSSRLLDNTSSDGTTQSLWWVCNKEKTPYIHIQEDNGQIVPCCYNRMQKQKKQKTKTASTYTKTSGAPLTVKGSKGILNDSVTFMNKYAKPGDEYLRYYIDDDIVKILKSITGIDPEDLNMELAKQESWDKCVPEIRDIFKAGNIDYVSYATLLDETFKVNIVMYDENGLVLPNFKHGYFRRKNDYPFVLLYNQSSPRDPPSYVVIKTQSQTSPFIEGIPEINETRLKNTVNGIDIQPFDLRDALKEGWSVIYQKFDAYGKARRFVISDRVNYLIIQTSPQQPFDVPERLLPLIEPYSIDQIQLLKGALKNMKGNQNGSNVLFSSPTSSFTIEVPVNLPDESLTPYIPTSKVSEFARSIKLRRLARIVTENSRRVFANSITNDEDFEDLEKMSENLIKFASKIDIMDANDKYEGSITKRFSNTGTMYSMNGNLRVHSVKVKQKLIYGLQNLMMRNPAKLKEYKKMEFVPNFYRDSTDFIRRYVQSDQSDMSDEDILKLKDFNCAPYDVFEDLDILIERK